MVTLSSCSALFARNEICLEGEEEAQNNVSAVVLTSEKIQMVAVPNLFLDDQLYTATHYEVDLWPEGE